MAGGGIIELIGIASGYDANGAFLDMMLDRDPAPPPAADRCAAAWMAALPQAGEVESIDGREDALAVPGVRSCWIRVQVGDQVTTLRSSFDRVLAIRAEGRPPPRRWPPPRRRWAASASSSGRSANPGPEAEHPGRLGCGRGRDTTPVRDK